MDGRDKPDHDTTRAYHILNIPNRMSVSSGERAMPTKSKSSTTTDLLPNPHPGEILLEEFLKPMGCRRPRSPRQSGCRPGASTRSCSASAPSPPIRTCASRATSAVGGLLPAAADRLRADGAPPPDRRSAQGDPAKGGVGAATNPTATSAALCTGLPASAGVTPVDGAPPATNVIPAKAGLSGPRVAFLRLADIVSIVAGLPLAHPPAFRSVI